MNVRAGRIASLVASAAFVSAIIAIPAFAGTKLKFSGLAYGDYGGQTLHYSGVTDPLAFVGTVYIQTSTDDGATWGTAKQMLCIDLQGLLPSTADEGNPFDVTYEFVSSSNMPFGVTDSRAWDMAAMAVDTYLPSVASNADGSRLQALVWEAIRDKSADSTGLFGPAGSAGLGDFWIENASTPSWATGLDSMFSQVASASTGYGTGHAWYRTTDPKYQDLVFFDRANVPEVPAFILGPLGLAMVAAIRRKIRR